ncbi:atrA protein, partial [Streptomyces platensis subsp. clarensis]|nr:atrA protein [Streptomyces platensis subsp. clarensis]
DLAAAMSKELGIKLNFNNATFDTLMGGLKSKRYDIAMSAMTDTKERQEGIDSNTGKKIGKGVDFIDYLNVGVSLYTRKGKTNGVDGWETLCGKKIAVQRGTVSHDLAKAPYGIAVPKGQDRLRDALKAAVERTIKNGSYAKVLDKWDVKDAAVKKVQLNGG